MVMLSDFFIVIRNTKDISFKIIFQEYIYMFKKFSMIMYDDKEHEMRQQFKNIKVEFKFS